MEESENSSSQDEDRDLSKDISSDSAAGIITGNILWINDSPPEEELIETYGTIEMVGNKVRIID